MQLVEQLLFRYGYSFCPLPASSLHRFWTTTGLIIIAANWSLRHKLPSASLTNSVTHSFSDKVLKAAGKSIKLCRGIRLHGPASARL